MGNDNWKDQRMDCERWNGDIGGNGDDDVCLETGSCTGLICSGVCLQSVSMRYDLQYDGAIADFTHEH